MARAEVEVKRGTTSACDISSPACSSRRHQRRHPLGRRRRERRERLAADLELLGVERGARHRNGGLGIAGGKRSQRLNTRQLLAGGFVGAQIGRNVRAGSDRWQPRILQSEPVLPRARIRSAQDQAEAILLLIHASPALGVGGRIFKANAAPVGSSWMWTLAFGHHEDRTPTHGYAESREAAMTTFAKSWRRE